MYRLGDSKQKKNRFYIDYQKYLQEDECGRLRIKDAWSIRDVRNTLGK